MTITTRSIGNFVAERMVQALDARGMSSVELAARMGVTANTISRWKTGNNPPSASMLETMALALRVNPEWLTRPLAKKLSNPYFRGSVAQMKRERSLLGARLSWLEEVASQLEDYVDYPKVNLPNTEFQKLSEITDRCIEDMAETCRELWGLGDGPVGDLLLILENNGVIVSREETGISRIEGLSAWTSSGRPLVLLSSDKGNAFRSRFDAAHELGHLVLHKQIPAPGDSSKHKVMESQAHRFAGAFLLPAESFVSEVTAPVTLHGLLYLKQRWGVSVAAMILRLRALGLVGEEDYLRLIKHRSAKWGVRKEPLDDERSVEVPRLMNRTLDLLVSEGVLKPDAISDLLGISTRDIESLMGLPFGTLSSKVAEVVELQLRSRRSESGPIEDRGQASSNVIVGDFGSRKK